MKSIKLMLLGFAAVGLVACGGEQTEEAPAEEMPATEEVAPAPAPEPAPAPATDSAAAPAPAEAAPAQ